MSSLLRSRRSIFHALFSLLIVSVLTACSTTGALEIAHPPAKPDKYAAIVVDANDGRIVYSVAADKKRYPASLTKMMTLYLLFEALDTGRLSKSSTIRISAKAARQPASKLYLKDGDAIDVDTAIRALVVKSANDVATAVAEELAGSEAQFARRMTAKARALGMSDTVFTNASGLPDPNMTTTARDMALLGLSLRHDFPHHYHYFSLRSFEFRGKTVRGHNKTLETVAGADGIKTGYIKASGYNLVTSVNRSGRSVVAVVMGGDSGRARDAYMAQLIAAMFNRLHRQ